MTRRIHVTAKQIWEKRAFWYADHYARHQQANAYSMDQAMRTLKACQQMPEPMLEIDGALDTHLYNSAWAKPIDEQIQLLRESGTPAELFVKWYWTEDEWTHFVKAFNGLPEPEPLYEIVFDGYSQYKVVPYMVGTSRGQVRYKVGTNADLYPAEDENPQAE